MNMRTIVKSKYGLYVLPQMAKHLFLTRVNELGVCGLGLWLSRSNDAIHLCQTRRELSSNRHVAKKLPRVTTECAFLGLKFVALIPPTLFAHGDHTSPSEWTRGACQQSRPLGPREFENSHGRWLSLRRLIEAVMALIALSKP